MCLVCLMLPVSLDCPFTISRSVFSNVYLNQPVHSSLWYTLLFLLVIYATIYTYDIRYYFYVWYTLLFIRMIYDTISTCDIRYYFYVWYTLLFLRMIYATISTYDIRYYFYVWYTLLFCAWYTLLLPRKTMFGWSFLPFYM